MCVTALEFNVLVDNVHQLNGFAMASHVDKESFSIIAQLGFIPDDFQLDALEISPFTDIAEAPKQFPDCERFPLVTFSDAHYLKDIGIRTTRFLVEKPTIEELKMALTKNSGRKVVY